MEFQNTRIPERDRKENEKIFEIFEEIMNKVSKINERYQTTDPGIQRTSNRINTNMHIHTPRHIKYKLLKIKEKEKTWKAAREKINSY